MRVQRRTGDGRTQRHLGGHGPARAAQGAVAHRGVDGGTGGVEGGPDIGEFKEWSEWVNLHGQTVSCPYW
ncbi:hypothetical protein GCM10027610_122900 [Dactylosporangium cerinum]